MMTDHAVARGIRLENRVALVFISLYRAISYALPRLCRHYPTCSEYSWQAFLQYPFFKACKLTVTRLLRCHPLSRGGYDPLP